VLSLIVTTWYVTLRPRPDYPQVCEPCAGYETSPALSESDFTFLAGVLKDFGRNDRKLGIEEEKAAGVSLKIHSK
jgi:hypothetical protein